MNFPRLILLQFLIVSIVTCSTIIRDVTTFCLRTCSGHVVSSTCSDSSPCCGRNWALTKPVGLFGIGLDQHLHHRSAPSRHHGFILASSTSCRRERHIRVINTTGLLTMCGSSIKILLLGVEAIAQSLGQVWLVQLFLPPDH